MKPTPTAGFTIVELMIVVLIIGILSALAMPAWNKVRESSRHSRLANDLRLFSDAIDQYSIEAGIYPAASTGGTLPTELAGYMKTDVWNKKTIIGGRWSIARDGTGFLCAIGVVGYYIPDTELSRFDQRFDDGDLSDGRFRKTDSGYFRIVQSD